MRSIPATVQSLLLPPGHLNIAPLPIQPAHQPFVKNSPPISRRIAPPLAVLSDQNVPTHADSHSAFMGFRRSQFRPPQAQVRPRIPMLQAPYQPQIRPNHVMTYAEVEALINARLNPPPQSMLPPKSMLSPQSMLPPRQVYANTSDAPPAYALTPDPSIARLTYEAREPIGSDVPSIEAQLGIPNNARFEDLVTGARMFDHPASRGGWRPRPPHPP